MTASMDTERHMSTHPGLGQWNMGLSDKKSFITRKRRSTDCRLS
jgi:hypothetical protein